MPKHLNFTLILCCFFLLFAKKSTAQCTLAYTNSNQPTINIVTNSNCEAEFNASPYVATTGNCPLQYFKDAAKTMPYVGLPAFNVSNLGQTINIFVAVTGVAPLAFQVKIIDSVAPSMFCPSSATFVADGVSCVKIINSGLAATAIDNCGGGVTMTWQLTGATMGSGSNAPNGQTFTVGQTIIKYTGTDLAGNTGTCNATVTLTENVAPTLVSCPPSITLDAPTGTCNRMVVTGLSASFTDNCAATPNTTFLINGVTLAAGQGSANSTIFNVGKSLIRYFATDNFSNTNSGCSFTVTIRDIDKPVIVCPTDLTVNTLQDSCYTYISSTSLTPVRFDNCGQNNISTTFKISGATTSGILPLSQIANQRFFKGQNTVTFTATDASGNSNTCAMSVLIQDKTKPTLACGGGNILENTSLGLCEKVLTLPQPTFSDNCTPMNQVVLTYKITGTTIANGTGAIPATQAFKTGKSTVTYTATDSDANTAICSYTVFLKETPAIRPDVVCRQDTFVLAEQGKCTRLISNGLQPKAATDNCSTQDAMTLTARMSGATILADTLLSITKGVNGFTFNGGLTTVRYILKDASGNADTCTFSVNVLDQQKPVIQCITDLTVSAGANCQRKISGLQPTATDNCGSANLQFTYLLSGATPNPVNAQLIDSVQFKVGVTTVKFFVRDAANNRDTCQFKVTVTETTVPLITCPNNLTINTLDTTCTAFLQNIPNPVFSDNCTINANLLLTYQTAGATSINGNNNINGKFLNYGTNSVTYKIKDFSDNTAQCTFNILVKDAKAPTIVCPANLTVNALDTACYVWVTSPNVTFADNCTASLSHQITGATLANGNGVFSQQPLNVGLNNAIYTVKDLDNNTSTCAFTIFVKDQIAPKITCPASLSVNTGNANCTASMTNLEPLISDNCSNLTLSFASTGATNFMNEMGTASNRLFNKGINIVAYQVTDIQGNMAFCTFTMTVKDITPPVISCKNNLNIKLDNTGNVTVNPKLFDNASTDNCTPAANLNFSLSKNTFNCSNLGDNALVLTLKDDSGNASTCPVNLNVQNSPNNIGFTVTASATDETYWGAGNGTATLNISGGVGAFNYAWSNGKITQNLFDLDAGTYTVTVSDAVSGCKGNAQVVVKHGVQVTVNAGQNIVSVGQTIDLPIRVQNFNKINKLSFTLKLNTLNIAKFEKVENFGIAGLDTSNVKFQLNRVTVNFTSATPISLANGTALFTIKTKITGAMGDLVNLNFEQVPTPILVEQTLKTGVFPVPCLMQNGTIGISNGNVMAEITSNIKRENGTALKNVKVSLSGTYIDSVMTNGLGQSTFNLPMGTKAILKPYRNDNHKNGVTATDLVMMQRHILGLQLLDSPYKKIAADINKNGVITASDLTEVRYLLLGTIPQYNKNTSWRFVPTEHVFAAAGNNSVPLFPDSLSFNYLLDNQLDKNFVAIKIGDINFTANPNLTGNATSRNAKTMDFYAENSRVEAGENFEIVVKNQNANNIEALELNLNFDAEKLIFKAILGEKNNVFTESDVNLKNEESGNIRLLNLWKKPVQWSDNEPIVKLIFSAKENISDLNKVISTENSTVFANEEEHDVRLNFKSKIAENAFLEVKNALPNPAQHWVILPISTNEIGTMQTRIIDLNGRVVATQNDEIFRPEHELKINVENLPQSIYIIENQLNGMVKKQKLSVVR